jgi:1-deoxy-D-xylulose-5-phosphate synthase
MALCLKVPGMAIFAPSSVQDLRVMLRTAVELEGPAAIRYPKGAARDLPMGPVGSGLKALRLREGDGEVCILAVGKMVEAAEVAVGILLDEGINPTLWDVRLVRPLDPAMVTDAARHRLVVTVEDGIRVGGAGTFMADAIADLQESRQSPPVLSLGTPTSYIPHGKQNAILAQLGLDGPGIAAATQKALLGATVELTSD